MIFQQYLNIGSYFITCFLYFYGIILLYITFLAKKNSEKEAFHNNLANSLILIFSITASIIIINFMGISTIAFIVFPFDIFMLSFILLFLPLFYYLVSREKKRVENSLPKQLKQIESSSTEDDQLPLRFEIYRKLTHLVVLGIILFYFTLGFILQNVFKSLLLSLPESFSTTFYSVFGIDGDLMIFTQYLVVFLVGISLIGLLTADFVRILDPENYPLKPVNRILRKKELNFRIGPHISMAIGCFSVIILYGLIQPIGPLVICTTMAMAIFGDVASNLIGRTLGKKHIRETKKTYEGLFGGIIVAFISGLLILFFLRYFFSISILGYFLYPIIGAILIGFIDYIDLDVDDNLTYNFVITTILFFIALLIE